MGKTTLALLAAAVATVAAFVLMTFSSSASAQVGPVCGSCWHSPAPEPSVPASPLPAGAPAQDH